MEAVDTNTPPASSNKRCTMPLYDPAPEATQRQSNRLKNDQRLRSYGYEIAARPRNGTALWFTPGKRAVITQEEALKNIDAIVGQLIDQAITDDEKQERKTRRK